MKYRAGERRGGGGNINSPKFVGLSQAKTRILKSAGREYNNGVYIRRGLQ